MEDSTHPSTIFLLIPLSSASRSPIYYHCSMEPLHSPLPKRRLKGGFSLVGGAWLQGKLGNGGWFPSQDSEILKCPCGTGIHKNCWSLSKMGVMHRSLLPPALPLSSVPHTRPTSTSGPVQSPTSPSRPRPIHFFRDFVDHPAESPTCRAFPRCEAMN